MPPERAPTHRSAATLVRVVVAVVLCGWLGWMIVTEGFAALAARTGDGRMLAIMGTPRYPAAGAMLAERLLAAKQNDAAAALARTIVLADPTNDRALRVLGLATEQLGRRDEAVLIMGQAAALGWRDTPTQLWILRFAAVNGDVTTLMQRADALARRNRAGTLTTAVFLASVTDPRTRAALIDSLAQQPDWRGAFFASVQQHLPATSVDGMATLYREMQAKGLATSAVERLSFVDRLIDLGQFTRARAFWAANFAIPAARLGTTPYDPAFALAAGRPADTPVSQFEWRLNPDLAGAIDFQGSGTGTSITIPANLTGDATILSQVLMLAPGTRDLTTKVMGQATAASAGWNVTCLPSGQELRRTLPNGADDELSHVVFDVPAEGCGAQRLSLTTRDQLEPQAVSIADVRIR